MKKIIYSTVAASMLLFSSCENFLDTESYTKADTSNYPATVEHAQQVIAGVYNNLNIVCANPQMSFFYVAELASDDRLGGGGDNDPLMQSYDLICRNSNVTQQFWVDRYAGIYRANVAIETLPNCTGYSGDDQKNQLIGEAYFLRAFYYYELASLYENVPLITTSAQGKDDVAQATPDQTWGQIMQDLKTAITIMPATPVTSRPDSEDGHVDRWCAEALAARAFLFYTGFYKKTDVTLPDGTTVTKADVTAWVDDCVANSGYTLVPDYRNLWAYTNRLTVEDYNYTKGKGLNWVEDDAEVNPESMFEIKFSEFASWSTTIGYGNGYALHLGMRGGQKYGKTFPFGQGWGAGPVAPNLWNDWQTYNANVNGGTEDPRMKASICQISAELPRYTIGGGGDFVQETDYYAKKTSPITAKNPASTQSDPDDQYWSTFESGMYGNSWANAIDNMQLNNIHDLVLIRFADVLLMQSELKGDATGMNRVRARAGLPAIAYTLENLQNERRWELCFEGIRWNDIRRWHIAETALEKQTNVPVYHRGNADRNTAHNGGYAARYRATNGFFPIPETQIQLSSQLHQNAGWDASSDYSAW